ncbi:MAG: hypothetical protein JWM42_328 [Burkholderia sp.]|nr:hypothetical protein [Burkholderia sp.]
MQPTDAKAANVYHYAIFMLQKYGEQWNGDPRALPFLDITVDMAYEACYVESLSYSRLSRG